MLLLEFPPVYLLVIYLDRSALSRFHLVSTVCFFTPFSLRPCCRFRLRVLIKRLYDSFPSVSLLTTVSRPAFSSLFFWWSLWSCEVSRTYNYEDACRITGRSAVAMWTMNARKCKTFASIVASYSIIGEIRLYHRVNQQRESSKKHSRIDYNFWLVATFFAAEASTNPSFSIIL